MATKEFLFVNKDPESALERPNRRSVNRQAQLFSIASRRMKLQASRAPRGWLSKQTGTAASEHGPMSTISPSRAREQPAGPRLLETDQNVPSDKSSSSSIQDSPRHQLQYCEALPYQVLDPFKTTHSAQPFTSTVIDYYTRSWSSTSYTTAPYSSHRDSLLQDAVAERVRSCLMNETHMYSLSVAVAARLRFVNGSRSLDRFGTMTSLDWLFHKATRLLREYFSSVEDEDGIDPQALVDVMDMFRASYYAQRGSAAKVHIRTFGALAGRVGGGDIRDLTFRWAWNLCDVLAAVGVGFPTFAPVVFTATTLNDVGKVPATLRENPENFDHLIGIGFQDLQSLLGSEMAILVQDLVNWAFETSKAPLTKRPLENIESLEKARAILSSLLWLPPPAPTVLVGDPKVHVWPQDCRFLSIRLALILWLLYAASHPATLNATRLLLPRLKMTLRDMFDQAAQNNTALPVPQQQVFIWITTICVLAAEQTESQEDELCFTAMFLQMTRAWYVESCVQLFVLAKRFLYFGSLQAESLKRLGAKFEACRHSAAAGWE